jgi:hypothetical protein
MKKINFKEMIDIFKTLCMFGLIAFVGVWITYTLISFVVWYFTMMFLYPTIALIVLILGCLAFAGITKALEIYNNK